MDPATRHSNCLIYPGEYVSLYNNDEITKNLKRSDKVHTIPAVNITELADSFKIEMAIPGVQRENLVVNADGNILSVCVVNQSSSQSGKRQVSYDGFEYPIVLPGNIDAQFISAEYLSGILVIHVSKTKQPMRDLHTRIVVY